MLPGDSSIVPTPSRPHSSSAMDLSPSRPSNDRPEHLTIITKALFRGRSKDRRSERASLVGASGATG
jgi:hypothetical protein